MIFFLGKNWSLQKLVFIFREQLKTFPEVLLEGCVSACLDFMLMFSLTRFVGNRHSPMSAERREVITESASSGKSTPNWSRMEESGGSERGSTGKLWRIIVGIVFESLVGRKRHFGENKTPVCIHNARCFKTCWHAPPHLLPTAWWSCSFQSY